MKSDRSRVATKGVGYPEKESALKGDSGNVVRKPEVILKGYGQYFNKPKKN
jgi:hypothetical protein